MSRCIVRARVGRSVALLLGLPALAACGTGATGLGDDAGTGAASEPVTAPAVGLPYVDTPEACMSRLPSGTTLSGGLTATDRVVSAMICREAGSWGEPVVVRDVTGDALVAVLAALRHPSKPLRSVCDASGRVLPTFALQLADGRWIHPEVPSDGCHPTDAAVRVLISAAK